MALVLLRSFRGQGGPRIAPLGIFLQKLQEPGIVTFAHGVRLLRERNSGSAAAAKDSSANRLALRAASALRKRRLTPGAGQNASARRALESGLAGRVVRDVP